MRADLNASDQSVIDGHRDDPLAEALAAHPRCAVARDLPPMETATAAVRLRRSQERTITGLWIAVIVAIAIGMVLFGRPA